MATNISSSLIANSSISQKQAKLNLPLNFPLRFTVESSNISYAEILALNSTTTINGTLKSITPITSGVTSNIGINSTLTNVSNLISAITDNTTINAAVISAYGLITPVTGTSAIGVISSLNISAISGVISSSSINITDYLTINLSSGTSSNSIITGQSIFAVTLDSDLISNTNINSTIENKQTLAPQTINATSTIISIETAIFTLVTNIVANTSIAIQTLNSISLYSDLINDGNIQGSLINSIESDLIQESDIIISQTWDFPIEFPLTFGNGLNNYISINPQTINADSTIANNYIQDLLQVDLTSNATISGTLTCSYKISSDETTISNIAGTISENINLLPQSINVTSDINTLNINNKSNLVAPVVSNYNIAGITIISFSEQSNINNETDIQGTLYNLIGSQLISETVIKETYSFGFPLTFPLLFDGLLNNRNVDSEINTNSIISGNISSMLFANVNENSSINGRITDIVNISSEIEVGFNINDIISDVTQLSSNISIGSIGSGSITRTDKLTGNIVSNSNLSATLKNNIGLVENFVSSSNINAKVSYLYFITLLGTFIKNSKNTEIFNRNKHANSLYTDYSDTVIQDSNILQTVSINSVKGQIQFNINKALTVQSFSVNANLSTVSDVFEMVIFNVKKSSSEKIITNKESLQFTNILYKTKF